MRPAGQHGAYQLGDRRQTNRFDVRPSDADLVQLQHLPRRVVHELEPAARVDDDDAFDHAGENRFRPRPIARLLRELAPDLLHRLVKRACHRAELVVAEAQARRRQIAGAIALRDAGDEPHAVSDPRGEEPRDRGAADEREPQREQR